MYEFLLKTFKTELELPSECEGLTVLTLCLCVQWCRVDTFL